MEIISKAATTVLAMLKQFSWSEKCTRWSRYCVINHIADGTLIFNLLTRELILLTKEEFNSFLQLDYLKKNWFVLPDQYNEREIANFVKTLLTARQPKHKETTNYTIFTTTDCNARCFYCFEIGCKRTSMSCETAEKVVQHIKSHCGSKEVTIGWLGGEPLFNTKAIDLISAGLQRENIAFTSTMISNGYLFDDRTVNSAVESWKLRKVQITLDGTEQVYNKIKAYIYRDTNPFEVVMGNITRLLESGIRVDVRLNMDLYNAEDLQALVVDLARRFGGKKGFSVYAHHLFKGDVSNAELYTDDEWKKRIAAMDLLNESLEKYSLRQKVGIRKHFRLNHCMADSGKSITILPDGNVGLCDQCTDTGFIGHIDREGYDAAAVEGWRERMPEIPECSECFYYLDCIKIKKCVTHGSCYPLFRQEKMKHIKRAMVCEYERWLKKALVEDDESGFADLDW